MFDHVGIRVSHYDKSKAFYRAAFVPLGYAVMMEITPDLTGDGSSHCGFGKDKPEFWIGSASSGSTPVHLAFGAASRRDVDAFYQAALAAGAQDNGAPGLRPQYHPDYYGAFVRDPDGNNIEAVCHLPESEA